MYLLLFQNSFSLFTVIGASIGAFALGLLSKQAVVAKQRKRILRLEDEMLTNHSRILTLEQKITESRKNTVVPDISARKQDRDHDLKAI